MRYTATSILEQKGDLDWDAANLAIADVPSDLLLDEDVARLWKELLPGAYVSGEASQEVAEQMRKVLYGDLERLRSFCSGDAVPYMARVDGKLVCFGFEEPIDEEESRAAYHAISRLDEAGVLETLGLVVVA